MENKYLSYLMGASTITDADLQALGVVIMGNSESGSYKLEIPTQLLESYKNFVREHLDNGFWNEIVGVDSIIFIFKHADGRLEEFDYSEANRLQIAKLCSQFNGDPLEQTSKLLEYIAGNDFYAEFMSKHHLAAQE